MLFLILSLFFKISTDNQNNAESKSRKKQREDYSDVQKAIFENEDYSDNYIFSKSDNPKISFYECSFENIVPLNHFSDSSLIYALKSQFQLTSNNFTSCSFSNSLLNSEETNFTMYSNQVNNCYNFAQPLSVCNIIRFSKSLSKIELNTLTFENMSYSCRGLYFSQCSVVNIKNLTITNANIVRNHGNAIMLTSTEPFDDQISVKIEKCNFIDCGESDYVIYSTLYPLTIDSSSFTSTNDQVKNGCIFFPYLASYTISKTKFEGIFGQSITFSDDERIIKPFSIRLSQCSFINCNKNIVFKLKGDTFSLSNITFSDVDFDSTLISLEGNTEVINFNKCSFSKCPANSKSLSYVLDIPENNREFNFVGCTISSSHFSSSQSCVYFGKTGRYTFSKTSFINLNDAGLIFSDENNGDSNRPLELELLEETSFPMCARCVQFNIRNSPISNCVIENLIFQSDLITFNNTIESITMELSNFSHCFSSYQGTSIIELPNNGDLDFLMDRCIFNYTHLLSGTAIEIIYKVKSVTFSDVQFVDIEGDIYIDIDKSLVENPGDIRILNCSFLRSKSSIDGAAIHASSFCGSRLIEIVDCKFINCVNKKSIGGAISFNAIYGNIQRCTFIDNQAVSGADIYYNIDKKNDKYTSLNDNCLTIEDNIFICNEDSEKALSLCYLNFESIANYRFVMNKVLINESLVNVYLFGYEKDSNISNGQIVIQNNCISEANKKKVMQPDLKYKIDYELAFEWHCLTENCPEHSSDESTEIEDDSIIENEENKVFYSCAQAYKSQLIIHNSILRIYFCSFMSIKARTKMGGAIYISIDKTFNNELNKKVEVHNCTFRNCVNEIGGAIYLKSVDSTVHHEIRDCLFASNECNSIGASLYLNSLFVTIENCIFKENKASKDGGAIFYEFDSSNANPLNLLEDDQTYAFLVIECKFNSNLAENRGGAIHVSVTKETVNGMIDISNCQFNECTAVTNGGGGVFFYLQKNIYGQISIQSNSFINCTASFGGAIFAFSDNELNDVVITKSVFKKNKASGKLGGGALFISLKNGKVGENLFLNNIGKGSIIISNDDFDDVKKATLTDDDRNGGLLSITNCIFESNSSSSIFYHHGEKKAVSVWIKNCIFDGKVPKGSHHIIGNVKEDKMLHIESCKFSDRKSSIQKIEKEFKFLKDGVIGLNLLIMACILAVLVTIFAVNLFSRKNIKKDEIDQFDNIQYIEV